MRNIIYIYIIYIYIIKYMNVEMNKETEMLGRNEVQEMEDSISQLKSSIINLPTH